MEFTNARFARNEFSYHIASCPIEDCKWESPPEYFRGHAQLAYYRHFEEAHENSPEEGTNGVDDCNG